MSKLRIGFVLTGSFCTFAKVMPVWHRRALAREADRTHRHLPYRQHCFRRADWTEGAV